jgi:ParB family chromosome partitioning protein
MMEIREIPIEGIDISEFNTRKNLQDGQFDGTIDDLANSIDRQGLLSPITVIVKPDGLYSLVAGQRRLLACRRLGWGSIPAIVREGLSGADATAISLVENVHRADMNPRDKAVAFNALLDRLESVRAVSRETGIGESTVRKYIRLLDLAPTLQDELAAGEARNTEALARLAKDVPDHQKQVQAWRRISGFTQDVQSQIISRLTPDLDNLGNLVDQAAEGRFGYQIVRNCPFDCPTIPEALKETVAAMISEHGGGTSA